MFFFSHPNCSSVRGDFQMFIIKCYDFSKELHFFLSTIFFFFSTTKKSICAPPASTTTQKWSKTGPIPRIGTRTRNSDILFMWIDNFKFIIAVSPAAETRIQMFGTLRKTLVILRTLVLSWFFCWNYVLFPWPYGERTTSRTRSLDFQEVED